MLSAYNADPANRNKAFTLQEICTDPFNQAFSIVSRNLENLNTTGKNLFLIVNTQELTWSQ